MTRLGRSESDLTFRLLEVIRSQSSFSKTDLPYYLGILTGSGPTLAQDMFKFRYLKYIKYKFLYNFNYISALIPKSTLDSEIFVTLSSFLNVKMGVSKLYGINLAYQINRALTKAVL